MVGDGAPKGRRRDGQGIRKSRDDDQGRDCSVQNKQKIFGFVKSPSFSPFPSTRFPPPHSHAPAFLRRALFMHQRAELLLSLYSLSPLSPLSCFLPLAPPAIHFSCFLSDIQTSSSSFAAARSCVYQAETCARDKIFKEIFTLAHP